MRCVESHCHLPAFLIVAVLAACSGPSVVKLPAQPPEHERPSPGACADQLTREILQQSLELGTSFMLNNQSREGNFAYMYDWKSKVNVPMDSQVRQAGATWGLTLIYQATRDPRLVERVETALKFFNERSHTMEDGSRYILYPRDEEGGLGTVALIALALTDYLRAAEEDLAPERSAHYHEMLDGYIRFLLRARTEDGLWHGSYRYDDGTPFGPSSPYSDGEALLVLVKAARYLGRDDLREPALAAAETGYRLNVVQALAEHPDSDVTRGFYQWSSMAYFELATSGWPDTERYGDWVLELADWMIDVHRVLNRVRNTAYAFEGIIHAYQVAVERGQLGKAETYSCVIDQGLERLTSLQIGIPLAAPSIDASAAEDIRALGGVQNHPAEPGLRIDVVQHQMHAVVLALRYVYVD